MSRTIVLIENNHFLANHFDQEAYTIFDAEDEELYSDLLPELKKNEILFDFSVANSDEKRALFELLEEQGVHIYSDLSCVWGDGMVEQFRSLKGGFATGIQSPNDTYEIWARNDKNLALIQEVFSAAELKTKVVRSPGFGFTFPRVLAQVTNEAYFSLQDSLAEREAIDSAMKFGAGYPRGPLEWTAHPVSLRCVLFLLDDLLALTGDPRYRPSLTLREEFLKNS